MKNTLPPSCLWSVLGVGKAQLPMVTTVILWGGNVRVGLEDNLYLRNGVLASINAQMIEWAPDLASRLGPKVATYREAREILGIRRILDSE